MKRRLLEAAIALAGAMSLMVLAGCAGDETQVVGTATPANTSLPGHTPVPWVDSTPGPTPSPTPFPSPEREDLAVRACKAADVTGSVTGGNGAGGSIFIYLAFSDISSEACRLEGVPSMQFLDANGQAEPTNWHEDPCLIPSVVAPCPHLVAILQPDTGQTPVPNYHLNPGQAALTLIYYGRPEEIPSYTPCPLAASAIAFDLPENGGRVVVPLSGPMSACVSPGVSQFGPAPTATPAANAGPPLTARLELPDTVAAGDTLEFIADLTDTSKTDAFAFGDLCPEYAVILGTKQAQAWHALNCHPVMSIGPGQTVSFAMELAIPRDVVPGSYSLGWTLSSRTYVITAGTSSVIEKGPYSVQVVAP